MSKDRAMQLTGKGVSFTLKVGEKEMTFNSWQAYRIKHGTLSWEGNKDSTDDDLSTLKLYPVRVVGTNRGTPKLGEEVDSLTMDTEPWSDGGGYFEVHPLDIEPWSEAKDEPTPGDKIEVGDQVEIIKLGRDVSAAVQVGMQGIVTKIYSGVFKSPYGVEVSTEGGIIQKEEFSEDELKIVRKRPLPTVVD